MTPVACRETLAAMKSPQPLFPSVTDWRGRWIWAPGIDGVADGGSGRQPRRNMRVLFRTEIPRGESSPARLCITADSHYRVWINGVRIGDGPPPSHPAMQLVDEYDLSRYSDAFGAGPLCLVVLVQHLGVDPNRRGGLLAELFRGYGSPAAATGENWRSLVVSGPGRPWLENTQYERMNQIHPFQEHLDLRFFRRDWFRSGADVSRWDYAEVLCTRGITTPGRVMPWARLMPRGIPFLDEGEVSAEHVEIEECLDLANRTHAEDLSISLSQVGRPLEWARVDSVAALTATHAGPGGQPEAQAAPPTANARPSSGSVADGRGRLVMACSTKHHDLEVDGRYDPCLTLDFGRVLAGRIELVVADAPEGATVEVGYAERLVDGRFNNAIECRFADKVTLSAGANTFLPLAWRSFRYVRLRLKYSESPVVFNDIRARELSYPYADRGAFESSREELESIEGICRNTIRLCSVESLMDTPHREQAQWLGDVALITVPGILACFGDTAIAGKFFRQATVNALPTGLLGNLSNVPLSDYQGAIPSFSLWWVISLERFFTYTGDERFLHYCYPEMLRVMRAHVEQLGDDGLLPHMPGWSFVDWAPVEMGGTSSVYNAMFAGAADAAARLAARRGDSWAAECFASAAAGVRESFAAAFFDDELGLVLDTPLGATAGTAEGEEADSSHSQARLSTGISEHAQGAALAFGCLDESQAGRVIGRVFGPAAATAQGTRSSFQGGAAVEAQPFFMAVVLEGLARHGRRDLAVDLVAKRWGRMLARGWDSCGEEWYINGSWRTGTWFGFERTLSHAWSAYAAEFLIRVLPGIEILEPGCTRVRVDPFPADFPYRSVFPLPQGELVVEWNGTAAGDEAARVTAPEGVVVDEG